MFLFFSFKMTEKEIQLFVSLLYIIHYYKKKRSSSVVSLYVHYTIVTLFDRMICGSVQRMPVGKRYDFK